jgi:glycosyltransferase involved in cell wall biosynthesis
MARRAIPRASKGAAPVIVLAANDSRTIANYRPGLVRALREAGFRVTVFAGDDRRLATLQKLGADLTLLPMASRGRSPVADLRTFVAYVRELRRLRPAAVLGFTVKPNIYGSLAAHRLGIPVINNITGLGAAFARETLLTRLVAGLYKLALRRSATVFFQNRDDFALFERLGLVTPGQGALVPGSGVDLDYFKPRADRRPAKPLTFLFAARLLWDKGVREYVEAARIVRSRTPEVRFEILGIVEAGRSAVSAAQLRDWDSDGVVSYLGASDDVRDALSRADCVVLPTYYREGVPRILLEAAAMGVPTIASDAPGCRDAVEDRITGFLCAPRDIASLVEAIERMIALPATTRKELGLAGRAKMQRGFGERIVHRSYLDALAKLGIQGARS